MRYAQVVAAYQDLEATTSRRQMSSVLVALLRATPVELLSRLVYLTQGQLAPQFAGLEIGMAEQLALRAVALGVERTVEETRSALVRRGDLGSAAEELLQGMGRAPVLSVDEVYAGLEAIARASGPGSIAQKVDALADLLRRATPVEARYLVRTVTGKLRLGVADMTLLDALATAFAEPANARPIVERAYNLSSDLGEVAVRLARDGLTALAELHPEPFHPIRPMLAERLKDPAEILAKLGGRCAAEYKYDGERVQVHRRGDEVRIYSRRGEVITAQYPDVVDLTRACVPAESAIFEAEAVARNPETGDLLPFQELMRRKRIHGVAEKAEELPVSLMLFDLLSLNGEDYTTRPYPERHAQLERLIKAGPRVQLVQRKIVESTTGLQEFFELAVSDGTEGLVCKSLAPDSFYQAGSRGFLWIKFKRDYVAAMTDSVDLVVVGALHGRGRRGGVYGSLLLAAYDPSADVFRTVTKVGAGFSDANLAALPGRLTSFVIPHRHPRVDAKMVADVWFVPALVLEVIGAEVTLSPIHTAGLGRFRPEAGLAIRFPRFTGRWRDDKAPEDATTIDELVEMYRLGTRK